MIKNNNNSFSSVYDETTVIGKIYKGTLKVYESWRNLIASGVPPLTLLNCKGVNLVDYKIYGNSVQDGTPTPETPIEVESVGDKTKNLITENSVFSAKNIFFGVKNLNDYNTFEAGTYSFSVICSDGGVTNLYITNADTNENILVKYGVTTITFTLTETTNIKIKAYDNRFVSKDDIVSFQLEIGETSTEHEPYNKYKIPVKVSGKNLLIESLYRKRHSTNGIICEYEGNGIFRIYGEHTAGSSASYFYLSNFSMPVPLIGNEYYTYSAKLIEGITTHNIIPYLGTKSDTVSTKNWLAVSITPNTMIGETITKTLKANYYLADTNSISNMWFYINVPVNETIKVDCRIQVWLEKGYEPSEYEPYVEPIITDIYLDEPLRKIGDYVDYINFKNKKVVRNIYNEYVSEVEFISSDVDTYKKFLTNISQKPLLIGTGIQAVGYAISNKFAQSEQEYRYLGLYSNLIQPYKTNAGINRIAYTFDDSSITTLEQAQEKIGNGFEVNYVLATPKEETIELPNIPTIKGTTILEVDTTIQPSNLEVVYKGK